MDWRWWEPAPMKNLPGLGCQILHLAASGENSRHKTVSNHPAIQYHPVSSSDMFWSFSSGHLLCFLSKTFENTSGSVKQLNPSEWWYFKRSWKQPSLISPGADGKHAFSSSHLHRSHHPSQADKCLASTPKFLLERMDVKSPCPCHLGVNQFAP